MRDGKGRGVIIWVEGLFAEGWGKFVEEGLKTILVGVDWIGGLPCWQGFGCSIGSGPASEIGGLSGDGTLWPVSSDYRYGGPSVCDVGELGLN